MSQTLLQAFYMYISHLIFIITLQRKYSYQYLTGEESEPQRFFLITCLRYVTSNYCVVLSKRSLGKPRILAKGSKNPRGGFIWILI